MAASGFQLMVMSVVGSIIFLVLIEQTLACRRGEPRSDLNGRISLVEEMLILPSDGSCLTTESGTDQYGKILASHDDSKSRDIFNVNVVCVYVIRAKPPFQRVMLDFRWFDVSRRYIADPSCEHAGVTFYDGPDPMTSPLLLNATCGSQRPQLLTSTQSSLSMVIYASGNLSVVDFMAVYSSFGDEQFCDSTDESEPRLVCLSTNRCIPKALSCDRQGVSNCGDEDYSDQLNELAPSFCPVVYDIDWTLFIIILACVAGLVIIFLINWCCWRPGYIPWYLGRCRRTRCCELGGCCTTPSRHFCSGVCPCKSCPGCPCVTATGEGPVPGGGSIKSPRNASNRQGTVGQSQPTPRSESGRHDVNTPNNVFLVVDDGRGPIGAKGGKTNILSRQQPFRPAAHTNQDSRKTFQTKTFPAKGHHPSPDVSEDPVMSKVFTTNSPSGPLYGKRAESSPPRRIRSPNVFMKKRVNPTFEPMTSAQWTPTRSGLQRHPLGAGPRREFFPQGSRRLNPDDETPKENSFMVYSDGAHVREGR